MSTGPYFRRIITPTPGIPDQNDGYGDCIIMELFVDFLVWTNGAIPSAKAIARHLGVSRATSYRYRATLRRLYKKYGALKFERAQKAHLYFGR